MWRARQSDELGFTLVELMISVAIAAVLLVLGVPSFIEYRQRSALRGAADQIVTFWADSRFEALRRNSMVKISLESATRLCLGAELTTSETDSTACGCATAAACDVSSFPGEAGQWQGVTLDTASSVTRPGSTTNNVVVIHPKRAALADPATAGSIPLQSPGASTTTGYRLNVVVNRNGRAFVCEPADAPSKMTQFSNKTC